MPTILAIDDRQDNLFSLSALLKSMIPGCKVVTALSGSEGIEKAKIEKPDTILLDIHMPGMDGFEACRILKSSHETKHIPVIMLTAVSTDSDSRVKGLEIGADAFLTKPVDRFELTAQVKAMLRIKYAEDILRRESEILEQLVAERTTELVKRHGQLIKEIEERKQAEIAQRESEDILREAQQLARLGNWSWNLHSNKVQWSDEMYTIYDFEKGSEPNNEEVRRRIITEDLPEFDATIQGVEKGNIPDKIEYRIKSRDERIHHLISRAKAVFDESGALTMLIGTVQDITESKQAEDKLRESEERFRALFENAADAFFLSDVNGRFLDVNRAACVNLGYTREELLELSIADVDINHDPDKVTAVLGSFVQNESRTMETIHKCKDGKTFPAEVRVRRFGSEQRPLILSLARDMTNRKRAAEEKRKLEAQLRQAQKMEAIGTLAGGIAHDFNNILFPIIGYTEMMFDKVPEGSDLRKNINEVLTASFRAKDLVQQILAFSRQAEKELQPIKTQIIFREVLRLMRASLPSTIFIKQDIDKQGGMVLADPTHIQQIAMNLITNAFHAMEENGGTLTITLSEVNITAEDLNNFDLNPGKFIHFSVSDTGHGIQKHVLDRIFEPYFTTKKEGKGTGLGLSVIHGIVKSYKGDIHVYSEPDKGTVFNVYLPVIDSTHEETSPIMEQFPVQGGDEHILLVDDEEQILKMEKQMLERLGYRVTSRTSSMEALEAFHSSPDTFDLVVTDMTMPNMTGEKLAIELKRIKKEIPVILCTGFSEKMSKEKAEALGIDGFLLKPIVRSELFHKIRNALDSKTGE